MMATGANSQKLVAINDSSNVLLVPMPGNMSGRIGTNAEFSS